MAFGFLKKIRSNNQRGKEFLMRMFLSSTFCVISAFLLCVPIFAQQPTATLTGVVTDANGAVIPGATIEAKNKATNLTRTVASNGEGVYVIASLTNIYTLPNGRVSAFVFCG